MNDNFNTWIETLRTTELPQVGDYLSNRVRGLEELKPVTGFCCLGIACKIAPGGDKYIDSPGSYSLLPPEVADWLGLRRYFDGTDDEFARYMEEVGDGFDLELDIPSSVLVSLREPVSTTAASLNDRGFTFAQIADMLAYFGVKALG